MDDVEKIANVLFEANMRLSAEEGWAYWQKVAQEGITAYKAWLADNGWVIVPREATEAMIEDTWDFVDAEDSNIVAKAWAAMLKEGEMQDT